MSLKENQVSAWALQRLERGARGRGRGSRAGECPGGGRSQCGRGREGSLEVKGLQGFGAGGQHRQGAE